MNLFGSKDPSEKMVLTFDFSSSLDVGETLSGAITVTVSMQQGSDVTPAAVLNGAASFDATNKMVLQGVQGGIDQRTYLIKVVVGTTNAKKVLALSAAMPVATI